MKETAILFHVNPVHFEVYRELSFPDIFQTCEMHLASINVSSGRGSSTYTGDKDTERRFAFDE